MPRNRRTRVQVTMYPTIRRFAKSKTRPIGRARCTGRPRSHRSQSRDCDRPKGTSPAGALLRRSPMSAQDEYEGIWEMFAQMHRQTHGENHVATRDFNCCGEYAVLMALRAASTLRPNYPHHLLLRMAAMPELDRDFYVKNLLSTDGEPEPSDPEPLREYRASRRYHILWTELKEAADRIASLEKNLEASEARVGELEALLKKAGASVPSPKKAESRRRASSRDGLPGPRLEGRPGDSPAARDPQVVLRRRVGPRRRARRTPIPPTAEAHAIGARRGRCGGHRGGETPTDLRVRDNNERLPRRGGRRAAPSAQPGGLGHHVRDRAPLRREAGERNRLHAEDRDRRLEYVGVPTLRPRRFGRAPRDEREAHRRSDDPPGGRRR